MCKIIAIANQKGGVGKTTTTSNLGIGLAKQGKRVLLIDADAQGSLTASLGFTEPDKLEETLATVMANIINDVEMEDDYGILRHEEGIDLMPGNIELSGLEVSLVNVMSRELVMRSYIEQVKDRYDYILIDCMPSLGMITINAFACADSILIPVQAAYLPVKGLEQLIKTIGKVKRQINPLYSHWMPLITTFLGTGCRVGGVIGLRWCDCDFDNGTISINHNLIYRQQDDGNCKMHITTPKTSAGCRTIPMLKEVRRALIREKKRQMQEGYSTAEIDGYSGFVFTNKNGYVHNPQTINRALERMRLACNQEEKERAKRERRKPVEVRHFSVHNLRHTFCTRFCENETNIKVIQEIMGHSDIGTTMNIYAEATEAKKRESFDNLEGKIKIS